MLRRARARWPAVGGEHGRPHERVRRLDADRLERAGRGTGTDVDDRAKMFRFNCAVTYDYVYIMIKNT